jgi:hypothetical protein
MRRVFAGIVGIVFAAAIGCSGGKHPVRGTVALEDGTPVTKGLVVLERSDGGPPLTARGEISTNGSFVLGTDQPGDGVPAGRYKVLINSMDLSDTPDEFKKLPYDVKYLKFETSGLEFDVKSGINEYPIKLNRASHQQ